MLRTWTCISGHPSFSLKDVDLCPICSSPTTEMTEPTPHDYMQERLFGAES